MHLNIDILELLHENVKRDLDIRIENMSKKNCIYTWKDICMENTSKRDQNIHLASILKGKKDLT